MPNVAELYPLVTETRYFGPARVLETDESENSVRVRIEEMPGNPETWCRVALPFKYDFIQGDEALIAGEDVENLYVIGMLTHRNSQSSARTETSSELKMDNGAYALIDDSIDSSESGILRVFSKRKELLFEYDPVAEKARVMVESGDLEFATQDGDITISSARNIRLDGQEIDIRSRSGIRLGVADIIGQLRSALSLGPRKMKITSPELDITAQRSLVHIEEMRYTGKRFLGKVGYVQLIAQKLETAAKTVIEKAENVYRTVRQLTQLKTGRKRTIVDSTYYLKTKKSILKADDDFKVKADKIHLG